MKINQNLHSCFNSIFATLIISSTYKPGGNKFVNVTNRFKLFKSLSIDSATPGY